VGILGAVAGAKSTQPLGLGNPIEPSGIPGRLSPEGKGTAPSLRCTFVRRSSVSAIIGSGLRLRRSERSHGSERLAPRQPQAVSQPPQRLAPFRRAKSKHRGKFSGFRFKSTRGRVAFAVRRELSRLGRLAPRPPKTGPVPSVRSGRLEGGGWTGNRSESDFLTAGRFNTVSLQPGASLRQPECESSTALRRGWYADQVTGG
jgi:hypothetical protein